MNSTHKGEISDFESSIQDTFLCQYTFMHLNAHVNLKCVERKLYPASIFIHC